MTHDRSVKRNELLKLLKVYAPDRIENCVGLSFFYDKNQRNFLVRYAKIMYPDSVNLTIEKANEICDHTFSIFGLRKRFQSNHIGWHMDVKSGFTYPKVPSCDILPLIGTIPGVGIIPKLFMKSV